MDTWFWLIAILVIAGCIAFGVVMWQRRGPGRLRNRNTDAQRLTEAPIKRPPD